MFKNIEMFGLLFWIDSPILVWCLDVSLWARIMRFPTANIKVPELEYCPNGGGGVKTHQLLYLFGILILIATDVLVKNCQNWNIVPMGGGG